MYDKSCQESSEASFAVCSHRQKKALKRKRDVERERDFVVLMQMAPPSKHGNKEGGLRHRDTSERASERK